MIQTTQLQSPQETAALLVAMVDARSAAEAAARIARAAADSVAQYPLSIDDAGEIWSAATRARQAADRAEIAATSEEARLAARAAWAAVATAQEADARINAAIAESLLAPKQYA